MKRAGKGRGGGGACLTKGGADGLATMGAVTITDYTVGRGRETQYGWGWGGRGVNDGVGRSGEGAMFCGRSETQARTMWMGLGRRIEQ